MGSPITKETVRRLAELARLELTPDEEERLVHDLGKILDHFAELSEVDTANVAPMAGGTRRMNAFRADAASANTNARAGTESFPEREDGYLKIPGVFE